MENNDIKKNSFEVYEAIVIGIMLLFALQWTSSPEAIPLFDFYPEFFSERLLPILITFIWVIALFNKKYFKTLLFLFFSSITIVTIIRYSSNYAFRYFAFYIVGFIYALKNSKERERAVASSIILSVLFLFSGIHKINHHYLSGVEFEKGGIFISFFELWFPELIPSQLSWPINYLPHFSIFTELLLAVGLIFKPRLFVHLTGLFLLLLCFLNPLVLSVYFMLLPFFISISDGYIKLLKKMPFFDYLKLPYFWSFYIYITTTNFFRLESVIITNSIMVLFFIGCHCTVLIKYLQNKKLLLNYNINDFYNKKIWIIPTTMLITFLASIYYLPSPFGFKMFSGKRFDNQYYSLQINHKEACHVSGTRWALSLVVDVSWKELDNESCEMWLPTKSSREYVAKRLCRKFGTIDLKAGSSGSNVVERLGCF